MFERLGAWIDSQLRWPQWQLRRLRFWYLRRTCRHLAWEPDWFTPTEEHCARCYLRRVKPGWENAVMVFQGFGPWDSAGGFIGYGPRWTIYKDREEANRAKIARGGSLD